MEENNLKIDINEIATKLVEDSFKGMVKSAKSGLKFLSKKSTDFIEEFSIDFQFAFKKYLKNAYEKYSKIKTLLNKTEPKFLYDFFECNDLQKGNETIDPLDINNILQLSHFIIIDGNGGIGKSTMMKHLFINELTKKQFIPILFELKDYNNFEGTLKECIYKSITTLGCEFKNEYFEYALKNGSFLFLLDGYDEISVTKVNNFVKELHELCDKYSDNYFIMSSRPSENFISFQRFTVLKSLPFSKEKAINLIRKLDYDEVVKNKFIEQLDQELYDLHQSFASNPLLLTIMLLTYNDYAEIPDKLHVFYEQAFDTLYTKHDATKSGYKRELKSNLSKDTFIKIFSAFCFVSYIKEMLVFSKDDLDEIFNKIKSNEIEFDNENFLQDLLSAVCLMYNEGYEYRFTHRSFQEYFTARYILNLPDESQKKIYDKLINHKSFDNVLDMLFDMSRERFENNAVIPYLEKIEEECNEDRIEFYFKKVFKDCLVLKSHKGENLGYGMRIKNNFLSFLHRKYMSIYTVQELNIVNKITKLNNEFRKEIFRASGNDNDFSVKIEDMLENKIYKDGLYVSVYYREVKLLSDLLENIKKDHNTLKIELESLIEI